MLKCNYLIIFLFYYTTSVIAGSYEKLTVEAVFEKEKSVVFIGVCETDAEIEKVSSTSNILGVVESINSKRLKYQFRVLKVWKGPDKKYYNVVQEIIPNGLSIPRQPPFNKKTVYLIFGWIDNNVVKTYLNYPTREINPKTQVHLLEKVKKNYEQFYPGDIQDMLYLDKLTSE